MTKILDGTGTSKTKTKILDGTSTSKTKTKIRFQDQEQNETNTTRLLKLFFPENTLVYLDLIK